jgi:2-haloacid dehalogenase
MLVVEHRPGRHALSVNPSAVVFDAYGTLFDVASVARACAELTPQPDALVTLWRAKQLEYSWLRALIGPAAYVDFWTITADALDFAAERLNQTLSDADRKRALRGWLDVSAYADVGSTLEALHAGGRRCAILSNGSPSMLEQALQHARLAERLDAVLSVDAVRVYKPHPRVYQMATEALSVAPSELLFVSSNGWDAAGAAAYGLPVAWVNRGMAPEERLGFTPDLTVSDLGELLAEVAPKAS